MMNQAKTPMSLSIGDDLIEKLAQGLTRQQPSSPVATEADPLPPGSWLKSDSRYQFLKNPDLPEAHWDVSGAFIYRDLLLGLQDFFGELGIRLLSCVHDAPFCVWNSGRVKKEFRLDPEVFVHALQAYGFRDVPVHLTFTSSLLTSEHLADSMGNVMLRKLAEINPSGENGAIVCSELLADHIKTRFPTLKLIASVIKVTQEDGKGKLDYYRGLAAKYDRIMIHPDDNFNLELLQALENKDQYEILVNEPCIKNCQKRKAHYQILSQISMNPLDASLTTREYELRQGNNCQNPEDLLLSQNRRTLVLSRRELKQIYDLGFRNFKIQGRGMANDHAMGHEIFRVALNHDPELDHLVGRTIQRFLSGA